MKGMQLVKQQHTNDCGPAALMMVAQHYGKDLSMEELKARCQLTRDGISLFDLCRAAEGIGLRTLAIRCTVKELVERVPLPAIALWTGNHYVVVDEADDSQIHVLDPARGSMEYSHGEFMRGWYQENKEQGVIMVLEEAPIVATFRRYATQVKEKPSEEEWRELCDLVDKTVPNFHAILSNNGELPPHHYRLCCLVRRGFDNTDIKVLISENLSNITMTYKNLHRKILQAPGSAKDFKNFIRRIGQEQLS